jgi:phosphate uptake regulator
MKPSTNRRQQPRREFDTDSADIMAAELASDMLSYLTSLYNNADEDQKLDIIVRYSSIMKELRHAVSRVARAQQRRRRYPGAIETK